MLQLILHLVGDYLTQSDFMALTKRRNWLVAGWHAWFYALPFLILTRHAHNPALAWLAIWFSHFLIDWLGLARYVVWVKNWLGSTTRRRETMTEALDRAKQEGRVMSGPGVTVFEPGELSQFLDDYDRNPREVVTRPNQPWSVCSATGYSPDRPVWLATILLIVADNTLHLICNYCALRWL